MGLQEEHQEFLGAIVEDCLASIEEDTRSSNASQGAANNRSSDAHDSSARRDGAGDNSDGLEKMNPLQQMSMSSFDSVDPDQARKNANL